MSTRTSSINVYIATSLDGFIARKDGSIDWLPTPSEGEDYGWSEFISQIDAIIMGRITFEKVLSFDKWPYEGTHVVVLSNSRKDVPTHLLGKAEVMSGPLNDLLHQLEQRKLSQFYIDGGKTIQNFLNADLVDNLKITTIPVLIGSGIPLFGYLTSDLKWEHEYTKTYEQGLVKSSYRRLR